MFERRNTFFLLGKNHKYLANTVFLKLLNDMFFSEANVMYIKIPLDLNLMKEIV